MILLFFFFGWFAVYFLNANSMFALFSLSQIIKNWEFNQFARCQQCIDLQLFYANINKKLLFFYNFLTILFKMWFRKKDSFCWFFSFVFGVLIIKWLCCWGFQLMFFNSVYRIIPTISLNFSSYFFSINYQFFDCFHSK